MNAPSISGTAFSRSVATAFSSVAIVSVSPATICEVLARAFGRDDRTRGRRGDGVAGGAVRGRDGGGEGEHAGQAARCARHVHHVHGHADQRVGIGADGDDEAGRGADGRLHAVDEGVLEAAHVIDGDRLAGGGERGAHTGVAAEIRREQRIARKFVERARRLLAVDRGIQQELRGDADARGDHVEVGGRRVVVQRDGVLLDAEALRRQAVVEVRVGGGRQRRGDGGLQAGAGLGESLADADGEVLPVRAGAIAEAALHGVLELALEKTLLDDRLQGRGEVLDAHG